MFFILKSIGRLVIVVPVQTPLSKSIKYSFELTYLFYRFTYHYYGFWAACLICY